MPAAGPDPKRTCGECTACCDGWLRDRGYGSPQLQKDILDRATRGEPLLPGLNPGIAGPCKLAPLERVG